MKHTKLFEQFVNEALSVREVQKMEKDLQKMLAKLEKYEDDSEEGDGQERVDDAYVSIEDATLIMRASIIGEMMELEESATTIVTEASLSGIEFGNDDDIHPTKFKPLTISLKKNKVKMEVEKEKGDHGYPEVKLIGKREDIEKVLADVWGPDSVSDYEDAFESVVNEAVKSSDVKKFSKTLYKYVEQLEELAGEYEEIEDACYDAAEGLQSAAEKLEWI